MFPHSFLYLVLVSQQLTAFPFKSTRQHPATFSIVFLSVFWIPVSTQPFSYLYGIVIVVFLILPQYLFLPHLSPPPSFLPSFSFPIFSMSPMFYYSASKIHIHTVLFVWVQSYRFQTLHSWKAASSLVNDSWLQHNYLLYSISP